MIDPTREQIEAAAKVMNGGGIEICLPWEGDMDDLESWRYETFCAAIAAALSLKTSEVNK